MIAKHTFSQKRCFGTRFRQTVRTNSFLSQNDAKRNLRGKRRFGTRFRETVITNPVLTQNDSKTHFEPKSSFWHSISRNSDN